MAPDARGTGAEDSGPGATAEEQDTPAGRDLLDDIAAVVGVHQGRKYPVNVADIAVRLRDLAPDWEPYRTIKGSAVRAYLEGEFGITLPTTGRRYPVDPDLIRDLLIRRDRDQETDR